MPCRRGRDGARRAFRHTGRRPRALHVLVALLRLEAVGVLAAGARCGGGTEDAAIGLRWTEPRSQAFLMRSEVIVGEPEGNDVGLRRQGFQHQGAIVTARVAMDQVGAVKSGVTSSKDGYMIGIYELALDA